MEKDKILNFFKKLEFNESKHLYSVEGKPIKSSVSKIIKNFVEESNFKDIALATDKRDNLPAGTTAKSWDLNSKVSLAIGTQTHFFGEMYVFNRNLKPTTEYEKSIVKFWNDVPEHIVPVEMELKMYHKDYMFAGTADILLYNTITGKYIIGDYKTNKDLYKNFKGKTMINGFEHLLDCPINHYQLQLSFYQILLEQTGLSVENRKIIWVKPDGTYQMIDTEDYTDKLKQYLKNNKV